MDQDFLTFAVMRKAVSDMSDKKFTDEDIIKALELCKEGTFKSCKKCPFTGTCSEGEGLMEKNTLDLINRQKSEIETLKDFLTRKEDEAYERGYSEGKNDAAREVIEAIDSMMELVCAMTGLELTYFGKYAELRKKYTEEPK